MSLSEAHHAAQQASLHPILKQNCSPHLLKNGQGQSHITKFSHTAPALHPKEGSVQPNNASAQPATHKPLPQLSSVANPHCSSPPQTSAAPRSVTSAASCQLPG